MKVSLGFFLGAFVALAALADGAPYPLTGPGFPGGTAANWEANAANGTGIPGGIPARATGPGPGWVDMTASPYNCDPTDTTDCGGALQAAEATFSGTGAVLYFPAGTYKIAGGGGVFNKGGFTIRGAGDSTVFDSHTAGPCFYFSSWGINMGLYGNHTAISGSPTQGSISFTVASAANFAVGSIAQISENNDLTIPVFSVSGSNGAIDGSTAGDRSQIVYITNISGNTVTISTPLMWTLSSSLNPQLGAVYAKWGWATGIGLENFKLDSSNAIGATSIWFQVCWNCWMKNVHVTHSLSYHVELQNCFQIEMDHCWLDTIGHGGPNGAGLDVDSSSNCLVQDCIINYAQPLIEINTGASGNVFGYNLLYDTATSGWCGPAISTHSPGCAFNLYEGNIAPNFQSDGYYGTEDLNLAVFRNWLEGADPGNSTFVGGARQAAMANRFGRAYLILGNLLGTHGFAWPSNPGGVNNGGGYMFGFPNIGNTAWSGTSASLASGTPWADWAMTGTVTSGGGTSTAVVTVTSAGNVGAGVADWVAQGAVNNSLIYATIRWAGGGYNRPLNNAQSGCIVSAGGTSLTIQGAGNFPANGTVLQFYSGSAGYQEQDLDVYTSSTVLGNWDVSANALPPQDTPLGSYTLPPSLYLTGKPSWFGNLAWPAFDTASPTANVISGATAAGYPAAFQNIPAGFRFVTGGDPPAAPSFIRQPAPVAIFIGATATFTVDAQASPDPTLQWELSTDNGTTWTLLTNDALYFGVTTSELTIKQTPAAFDKYQFRCLAVNKQGQVPSESAALRVLPTGAFAGIYFGTFTSGGNWALAVAPDNVNFFMTDIGGNIVAQNAVINPDGSFEVQSPTAMSITSNVESFFSGGANFLISGQITNGLVTGTSGTLTFNGAQDTGASQITSAGFYLGTALLGSVGTSYAVVGGDGKVFVIASDGFSVAESLGTLSLDGSYSSTSTAGGVITFASTALGQGAISLKPVGSPSTEYFSALSSTVASTSRITNLSARANSTAGSNPLTVGFVTKGGSKSILLRGIGPSLSEFGLSNPLVDPQLLLFQGTDVIQSNEGWRGLASLIDAFDQTGAFALPIDSSDCALVTTLPAGTYSTQVASATGAVGVALAEIYDADSGISPAGRLVNLSVRSEVGAGGAVLVAGFIISGNKPETVLLRGVGPGLAQFGVNNFLANPQLALFNAEGTLLSSNTAWGGAPSLNNTFDRVGAFSLAASSNDTALVGALPPGAYSAQVSGLNGSAGVALIEVYEVQ